MDFLVRLVMVLTSTSFKHFSFGNRSKACIYRVYSPQRKSIDFTTKDDLQFQTKTNGVKRELAMSQKLAPLGVLGVASLPISWVRHFSTLSQNSANQPFPNIFYDPLFTMAKKSLARLKHKEDFSFNMSKRNEVIIHACLMQKRMTDCQCTRCSDQQQLLNEKSISLHYLVDSLIEARFSRSYA